MALLPALPTVTPSEPLGTGQSVFTGWRSPALATSVRLMSAPLTVR